MLSYNVFLNKQYVRFEEILRDIADGAHSDSVSILLESKLLDRVMLWLFNEATPESNAELMQTFDLAMKKLCEDMESIIERNGLFWKNVDDPDFNQLKHWPENVDYVHLRERDAKYAEKVLQIFFLCCQPSVIQGVGDIKKIPVNPVRVGSICVSFLFAINTAVSMNALRTFTLLLCYDSFSPSLGFYQLLSDWILAVPCENGASIKNDSVSLLDYIDGTADPEKMDSIVSHMVPHNYTGKISDHVIASEYRFRHSLKSHNERVDLVAQQAFSIAAFALISDFSELNNLIANWAPKTITSIIELYLRPLPDDPVRCEYHNSLRSYIIEALTLMIPATMVNFDEVIRKYRLTTLLYAFKDPKISENYFCNLIDIFEWLTPLTSHQILGHIIDISVEPGYPTVLRSKAMNAVYRVLLDSPQLTNITENVIATFLKGLNQDLDCLDVFINRDKSGIIGLTTEMLDSELDCRNLLDARVNALTICMEYSYEMFDNAIQQVPSAARAIYKVLTNAHFLNGVSLVTSLHIARIGAGCLQNDHARADFTDEELRKIIFEASKAAVVDAPQQGLGPYSAATLVSPLIKTMTHIDNFINDNDTGTDRNDEESIKKASEGATAALTDEPTPESPSFSYTCLYVMRKLLDVIVVHTEQLMRSPLVVKKEDVDFEYIGHFRGAFEIAENGLEYHILPKAINIFYSFKNSSLKLEDVKPHVAPQLTNLLNFLVHFVREDYQLPTSLAKTIIIAIGAFPSSDYSFLESRQLFPVQAFENIGNGNEDLQFIFAARALYEKVTRGDPEFPVFETYFNLTPNLSFVIKKALIEHATYHNEASTAWLHSELKKFMIMLTEMTVTGIIDVLLQWCAETFERFDSFGVREGRVSLADGSNLLGCTAALRLIGAYLRSSTCQNQIISRDKIIHLLRLAFQSSMPDIVSNFDHILRLGCRLPKEAGTGSIYQYCSDIQDILLKLLDIHGLKIVEMDCCSWLLRGFSMQEWFMYFTEQNKLQLMVEKTLGSVIYVLTLAPKSFISKYPHFLVRLFHDCVVPIRTEMTTRNSSHNWLRLFRAAVTKLTFGFSGDMSFSFNISEFPTINKNDLNLVIDTVVKDLFLGIVNHNWSDPYVFGTFFYLFSRNATERMSFHFIGDLEKVPKYKLQQIPWRNAGSYARTNFEYSDQQKIIFLRECEKAVKIYASRVDKAVPHDLMSELDFFSRAYLMVATSITPCDELHFALCDMVSAISQNLEIFDDEHYNDFNSLVASLARLAVLGDKEYANIILSDITNYNSPKRYPFSRFPEETVALNLTLQMPHLRPVLEGSVTELYEMDSSQPVLLQWKLAYSLFKEKLREGEIQQRKFDYMVSQMNTCLKGVNTFISNISDDRSIFLRKTIDELIGTFFKMNTLNSASHICTILKDLNRNTGGARFYILRRHPTFVLEAIKYSSQLLFRHNKGSFKEVYCLHDLCELFESIADLSLDESYSSETLTIVTDTVKWIISQVSDALTTWLKTLLVSKSITEAGCVVYTCLSTIALFYQQETRAFKWAEVDPADYTKIDVFNAPPVIRTLSGSKIFETWVKAYAAFDAESIEQRLFGKHLLNLIIRILYSDSFRVMRMPHIPKHSTNRFLNGSQLQDNPYPDGTHQTSSESSEVGIGSNQEYSSAIPHLSNNFSIEEVVDSDSDLLNESSEEELRNQHRQRIENSGGSVFRNSVLGDLESESDGYDYSSEDSSDRSSSGDEEMDIGLEINISDDGGYELSDNALDNEEVSDDYEDDDMDGDMVDDGLEEDIDGNVDSDYSYDDSPIEDNSGYDGEGGLYDEEFFAVNSLSELESFMRGDFRGGTGFHHNHEQPNGNLHHASDMHVPMHTHGDEEDDEGDDDEHDDSQRVNISFQCESIYDPTIWFWQDFFQRRHFGDPMCHFYEKYLHANIKRRPEREGDEHTLVKSDVAPDFDYVLTLKESSDVRATFSTILLSTIMRFMYADIRVSEMKRIKSICQWVIMSDDFRSLLLEKLISTLLSAVSSQTKPYKCTFEGTDVVPTMPQSESGTPSLVASNIMTLLTLLVSMRQQDLADVKFSMIGALRTDVAKPIMFKFAMDIVEKYGDHFIPLINEQLVSSNRKLLVCCCNFVDTTLTSYQKYLKHVGRRSEFKLRVKPAMLGRLVNILGSKECNWDVFTKITNMIQSSVPVNHAIYCVLKECRVTKAALVEALPALKAVNETASMIDKVRFIDIFMSNQIRMLRFISALRSMQTNPLEVVKAVEHSDFPRLWDKLFAHFSEIKHLHQKFGRSTLQALFEIVASPTMLVIECCQDEKIMRQKGDFFKFLEKQALKYLAAHKAHVNELIRTRPNIIEGPLGQLAQRLNLMDFNSKYTKLKSRLHSLRSKTAKVKLDIRRDDVLNDSFEGLMELNKSLLRCPLDIRFVGEYGIDAGGVAREWLEILSRELVNPHYALFIATTTGSSIHQVNPLSQFNSNHLDYFKFTGRVLGRAVLDLRTVGSYFSRVIYKYILGLPINLSDMEAVDDEYCRNLKWILENDVTDVIYETFSVEVKQLGVTNIIDLIPNGRDIPVTEENKKEYVNRIVSYRLVESVEPQLKAITEGFNDIVPIDYVSDFSVQEFELLVSGLPDIDIMEWKRNTIYDGYSSTSPQIKWFWVAVKSFSREERAKLLQFCTGTSRVPTQGFSQLESSEGIGQFSIHKERSSTNRLPTSHTCMNQLMLPQYETYKKLRTLLLHAITEGNVGFGFA